MGQHIVNLLSCALDSLESDGHAPIEESRLLALHPATVQGSRARADQYGSLTGQFHTLTGVRDCAHYPVDLPLGYDDERA